MLYEINQLTRVHYGRTILDIPALTIPGGEICSLTGPNGAGKSTLLHLLAFLDIPTTGTIRFMSAPVSYVERSLQPLRRRVVLLDQYPILFTGTVWKNLEFGLKVRNVGRKERKDRIEAALEMVGMQDFATAPAHRLSGGETKRVALARALVVQPEVLLCDEPTANVDSENQEIIQGILTRANRKEKISIIFATHSLSQVQRLADHTLTLMDGKLSEVSRENVFSAVILEQNGGRIVCRLTDDVQISVPAAGHAGSSVTVRLFLDPAKLVILPGDPAEGRPMNVLPGRVVKNTAENGRVKITVDTGVIIDIFLSVAEYTSRPPLIGETVLVHIPDQAITLPSPGR
ncbi:MAG: energy-coupling factor ABC transporter ATP-binding protein [Desulforhopalus sp.]|nr:energy-coupling factor ABC transporter ATP-binding protein [Desulforhopalus sp.]